MNTASLTDLFHNCNIKDILRYVDMALRRRRDHCCCYIYVVFDVEQ